MWRCTVFQRLRAMHAGALNCATACRAAKLDRRPVLKESKVTWTEERREGG